MDDEAQSIPEYGSAGSLLSIPADFNPVCLPHHVAEDLSTTTVRCLQGRNVQFYLSQRPRTRPYDPRLGPFHDYLAHPCISTIQAYLLILAPMDSSIQRALSDKVYDRRKAGALEVEKLVREHAAAGHWKQIDKVIDQLCHDFAYAIHQPYARNGGLIGLAAASIALGQDVMRYLEHIIPPVLACFADQDARVRYYACESMYNIAKTSKAEILPYFNEIFDALSKLAADSELSVKNGAELLDRLVKDIIADSATSYVSLIQPKQQVAGSNGEISFQEAAAFSLPRLIPLLRERVGTVNSFTRMFIVEWIQLLDSIPDLELITYIPAFLYGLFRFLNDPISDVQTATQHILERFSEEIRNVALVKAEIAEKRVEKDRFKAGSIASVKGDDSDKPAEDAMTPKDKEDDVSKDDGSDRNGETAVADSDSESFDSSKTQGEWIPGQDVQVDHPQILDILINVLRQMPQEHIQLTALKWISSLFDICPSDIIMFAPRLLDQVLPALSSDVSQVRQAAGRVNKSLMEHVLRLPDDDTNDAAPAQGASERQGVLEAGKDSVEIQRADTPTTSKGLKPSDTERSGASKTLNGSVAGSVCCQDPSLDYEGCVSSLTLQFLNEHEDTRVASLSWLIQLQRKAPKRVLAVHDGTFPALLKTLSDPSDVVVTRDLQLLSQIAQHSDEQFFTFFMQNLIGIFCTDRKLLETRGNLIIRQLCTSLSAERIYRVMAGCLERDEDVEFTGTMVEILNNNLITAPELADLRRKLRHWEAKDGQTFFVALYKAWCHNAIATVALCLLSQAYEQTYHIIQTFADNEMTSAMMIQMDKLIALLEAPVFTYLRLHLLDPNNHPYLYKTLYGILMLLPQSMAFSLLKNRLNAVSPLGYLSISASRQQSTSSNSASGTGGPAPPAFERAQRLKPSPAQGPSAPGEHSGSPPVRWTDLLDRYKATQERARRVRLGGAFTASGSGMPGSDGPAFFLPDGTRAHLAAGAPSDQPQQPTDAHARALIPPSAFDPQAAGGGARPASASGTSAASRIPALAGRWETQAVQGQTAGGDAGGGAGAGREGKASGQGHRSRFSASLLGRNVLSRATGGARAGREGSAGKAEEGKARDGARR